MEEATSDLIWANTRMIIPREAKSKQLVHNISGISSQARNFQAAQAHHGRPAMWLTACSEFARKASGFYWLPMYMMSIMSLAS